MKIQRKCLQNLVLDAEEFSSLLGLYMALKENLTAKLLDELFKLYQKGELSLWLRYHDGESVAEHLDEITLSGDKVEDLYEIFRCLSVHIYLTLRDVTSPAYTTLLFSRINISKSDIFDMVSGELVLDGEKINSVQELSDHPSTELLDLHQTGKLSLWLRNHDGKYQADKLDRLTLSGDKAEDLYAVCQAVGIRGITLEDIRNALEEEGESEEQPVENSVEQYK